MEPGHENILTYRLQYRSFINRTLASRDAFVINSNFICCSLLLHSAVDHSLQRISLFVVYIITFHSLYRNPSLYGCNQQLQDHEKKGRTQLRPFAGWRGHHTHLWENEVRSSGDAGSAASRAGLPYPNHHVLKLGTFVSKYLLRFLKYAARFALLMQEMCYFY